MARITKKGYEGIKPLQCTSAELGQRPAGTLYGFGRLVKTALAEEFVGITDDLLLKALGQEIARRIDRQALGDNLSCSDACTRVALTDPAVPERPMLSSIRRPMMPCRM